MKVLYILVSLSLLSKNIFCLEFHNIDQRLQQFGYDYETHQVITDDGYILTNYRIFPRACEYNEEPDVVLLGHGATSNGAAFLVMDPEYSLGFVLADNCIDTYLLNFRGSYYSRGHTNLSTSNSAYWEFSFHENGIYDLSASIDLALEISGAEKVSYIGHSEATNTALALLSEIPEYNNVLKNTFLFAPVSHLCYTTNPGMKALADSEKNKLVTLALSGSFDIRFLYNASGALLQSLGLLPVVYKILRAIDILDDDYKCEGYDVLPLEETLQGSQSSHSFAHLVQLASTCIFKPYQPFLASAPAPYPLQNIVSPVYVFAGTEDDLNNPWDMDELAASVPGFKGTTYINTDHVGFVVCDSSRETIYYPVIDVIKGYYF